MRLATSEPFALDLDDLVSYRFPLSETPHAFALKSAYEPGVHKIIIEPGRAV